MVELKPCPFCGGKAKIQLGWPATQKANKKHVFIMCKSCGCKTQTVYQVPYMAWDDCKRYAIEAWNRRAGNAIEELFGETEQFPKWIPVTERLPKTERKSYWVCTDTGYQCECRWTNDRFGIIESDEWGWKIFDIPQYQKVVAWMPLPCPYEPPKEET